MKLEIGAYLRYRGKAARVVGAYTAYALAPDKDHHPPLKGGVFKRFEFYYLRYLDQSGYEDLIVVDDILEKAPIISLPAASAGCQEGPEKSAASSPQESPSPDHP